MEGQDKLRSFYDKIKSNPSITGLPDDYEVFKSALSDTNKAKGFYDTLKKGGAIQGLPDDFSGFSTILPESAENEKTDSSPVITGFIPGLNQGADGLYQGGLSAVGEIANLGGTQDDYRKALEQLDDLVANEHPVSVDFDQGKALSNHKAREYDRQLEQYRKDRESWRKGFDDRSGWDYVKHVFDYPSRPVSPDDRGTVAAYKYSVGDEVELNRVYKAIGEALREGKGDVGKAKEILQKKAEKEQWGDRVSREAREALSLHKPTEGAAAWVGQMLPQMAGNAAAIAASVSPYTRWLARPLAKANMAALTASSAGSAMADARGYGASSGDVLRAGVLASGLEYFSEKLPFDRYFSGIQNYSRKKLGKAVADKIVNNDAAKHELSGLIKKAGKEFSGRFLSKTGIKNFVGDVAVEGLSEFIAEGGGAMIPMIYQNEADYPTLNEILSQGWEGAKGGVFMGGILGGASNTIGYYANRNRRKEHGRIALADTENGVVEVVGRSGGDCFSVVDAENKVSEISGEDILDYAIVGFDEFDGYAKKQTEENLKKAEESGRRMEYDDSAEVYGKVLSDIPSDKVAVFENVDDVSGYLEQHPEDSELLETFLTAKAQLFGSATNLFSGKANKKEGGIVTARDEEGRSVYVLDETGDGSLVEYEDGSRKFIASGVLQDVKKESIEGYTVRNMNSITPEQSERQVVVGDNVLYNGERARVQRVDDDGTVIEVGGNRVEKVPFGVLQFDEGVTQQEAQAADPEVVVPETPVADVPADTQPVQIPQTKEGRPDYNAMLESDPELFASEWEKRSTPESTKAALERQSGNIGRKVESLLKNLEKESDFNKIADIEDEVKVFSDRKAKIDGLIAGRYALREEPVAAQQAEELLNTDKQGTEPDQQVDIKPVGRGFFGDIYDQFKGRANEAINFLLQKKEGEAIGALHHPQVGDIDLVWGNEKTGLMKIARKHPEVLSNLQEEVDKMGIVSSSDNRIVLESPTHKAVVSKNVFDEDKQWLLTAYEKKKNAIISDSSIDIESEPEGKQNGTAPLQNNSIIETQTPIDRTTDIGENHNDLQNDTAPLQDISVSSESKDTEVPGEKQAEHEVLKSMAEQRKSEKQNNTPYRTLADEEIDIVMSQMQEYAVEAPVLELTPENWTNEFGDDGVIDTPIGKVKMGENQYLKFAKLGRGSQLGMVKPTLTNPDVVIEDKSGGVDSERNSSYVYVKTFTDKSGKKHTYFTSVTVLKKGMEVSVSSHIKNKNRVKSLLKEGNLLWNRFGFDSDASGEHQDYTTVTALSPSDNERGTTSQSKLLSESKDMEVPGEKQEGVNRDSGIREQAVESENEVKEIGLEDSANGRSDILFREKDLEIEAIKKKAIADNIFMKAPNGKPTNLTEKQWIQVRTKAFKDWFGDWENSPKNASKVVGENGEPKVVYHGSSKSFTEFNQRYMGVNGTAIGQGFYFTSDKSFADGYSSDDGNVFEVFLNLRKELDSKNITIKKAKLKSILKEIDKVSSDEVAHSFLSNYNDVEYNGLERTLNEAVEMEMDAADSDVELIGGLVNGSGSLRGVYEVLEKTTGHDGVLEKQKDGSIHFVVGRPNQIKSATDNTGSFSKGSDDIRYREGSPEDVNERFNRELDSLTEENANGKVFHLGMPSKSLLSVGIPNKPFRLYGNKLLKKAKKHGFTPTDIKNLPHALENPIAVFNGNHRSSYAILTELEIRNNKVLVSVETNKDGEIDFNLVSSVFGKSSRSIVNWINSDKLRFSDKEKTLSYLSASALYADATNNSELSSATNIAQNFVNPSIGEDRFLPDVDVLFRESEGMNERFNGELQQQIAGTLPKGHVYKLGNPSNILLSAGVPALPIELAASRLTSKSAQENHPFNLSEVAGLVNAVQNPLAVFRSATHIGSHIILTELKHGDKNFVVAVETNRAQGKIEVNSVRTVHPRTNTNILNWINEGLMDYADVEGVNHWLSENKKELLSKQRYNPADVRKQLFSATNILQNFKNPTIEEGEISSSIDELSKELGVRVHKVRSREDLPEGMSRGMKGGKYPGLFDPKSGKVYVVLNEIQDVADAQATVLHEVVGHKGIRGLFGERLPEFCERVLASLPEGKRIKLLEKYEGNRQLAAEEYVAGFAEEYSDPSGWEKVKAIVKEFLRDLTGIDLKLSDNDLKYILWKAKNGLKEGGMMSAIEDVVRDKRVQDVLFRQQQPDLRTAEEFIKEKRSWLEATKERFVDSVAAVKELTDFLKNRGIKIRDFEDAYSESLLSDSKSYHAISRYQEQYQQPLNEGIAALRSKGRELRDVYHYLIAKHASERNREIGNREYGKWLDSKHRDLLVEKKRFEFFKKNGKKDDAEYNKKLKAFEETIARSNQKFEEERVVKEAEFRSRIYAGMSDEDAAVIVRDFEANCSKEEISNLWEKIRAATNFVIDRQFKDGLIPKESYDAMRGTYEYYVPLKGWEETDGVDYSTSERYRTPANVSKLVEARGRVSIADNPVAYIEMAAEAAIVEGNRNYVRQCLYNMCVNNPDEGLYSVNRTYYVEKDGEWIAQTEKPAKELFDNGTAKTVLIDKPYKALVSDANAQRYDVTVVINGEKNTISFAQGSKGLDIADAINRTRMWKPGKVSRAFGHLTRFLSAQSTSRNPEFIVRNFERDFLYAVPAYAIKGGNSIKLIANLRPAFKALHREFMEGGAKQDSELNRYMDEFLNAGGKTGFVHSLDMESRKRKSEREIRRIINRDSAGGRARAVGKAIGSTMEYLSDMSENSIRFAVFLTERQAGKGVKEAAIAAKEITVNFNRKGTVTPAMSQYFAFFNAGVQGSLHNFLGLGLKWGNRFLVANVALGAIQMVAAQLSRCFGDDDELGVSDYDRLSDYTRNNNIVLPDIMRLSEYFGGGNNEEARKYGFMTIPMPQSFRAVSAVGIIADQVLRERKSPSDGVTEIVDNILANMSPLDLETYNFTNGKPWMFFLRALPTAMQPVVDLMTNKNFMGSDVFKEPFTKNMEGMVPQSSLGMKNTNPLLVSMSKGLNRWANGTTDINPELQADAATGEVSRNKTMSYVDINPAKVEHIIEGITGGAGKFVNNVFKTASSLVTGGELENRDVPFVRTHRTMPYRQTHWEMFFEARESVADVDFVANTHKKNRNFGIYTKILTNGGQLLSSVSYKYIDELVRGFRKVSAATMTEESKKNWTEIIDRTVLNWAKGQKQMYDEAIKDDDKKKKQ